MGRDSQACEVNWLALAVHGGGFLRFLLQDFGYSLDSGMVLIADNDIQARQFIAEYIRRMDCENCRVTGWKKRRTYPPNYCCGFMPMRKTISQEEVDDFLAEQDFLPIVICGGLFPEYLRADHYIFRMNKESFESAMSQEFTKKISEFFAYVKENTREVCGVIKGLKTSIVITEYEGTEELRKLHDFLIAVGFVYYVYLLKTQTERIAVDFFHAYRKETLRGLQQIQEFASGEIFAEILASSVWNYLYHNSGVVVSDLEIIDATVDKAIREKEAILFDAKFYYFSPELLMEMCAPLLQTYSETELKKQLKGEGIIHCNSEDYTVKKGVTNVYGIPKRPRFIWVHKESLLSPDNLLLEDTFYHENEEEAE